MIKLQSVKKVFNRRKQNQVIALNDVSLSFPEKGLIVLFGHSGSGKTTLLNVVGGLDKPSSGHVIFDRTDFPKYIANKWDQLRNENVGYIFQNYFLQPNETVFDNVSFSLRLIGITDEKIIEERVRYVLRQVNMDTYRNKLAIHLSGGQQQRVAIARALVKNPKVIIADEPTGNLDSSNKVDVMNIIKKISEESLVILVTHEPKIAQFYGDRIIEVKDGNIIDDYVNNDVSDNHFEEEKEIYLKDLPYHKKLQQDNLSIDYYTDGENSKNVDVKLVIRNNSLFIEVDSEVNQINLLNERQQMKLVDGKKEVKTREELLTTTFDREFLNTNNVKRSRNTIISFKNSLFIALRRILNFGRRGKLALFSFIITGGAFAFAMINIVGFTLMSPSDYMNVPDDYISYSPREEHLEHFFNEYGNDLEVLPFENKSFAFEFNSSLVGPVWSSNFNLSLVKHSSYSGSLANNEVIITTKLYEVSILYNRFDSIGIYNINQLVGERIKIGSNTYTIKDIVNSSKSTVYFNTYETLARAATNNGILLGYTDRDYKEAIMRIGGEFYFINGTKNERISFIRNNSNLNESNIRDPYEVAKTALANERTNVITNILTTSFVLIGVSLVGFYFIMRSSMFNRIYQLGLYRVLGVKKREIINSFMIEIILLVSISSLIGYILLYLLLNSLSAIIPLTSIILGISFFGFIVGIVVMYGMFLLLGLLPVFSLLKLTPTEIITKYDI